MWLLQSRSIIRSDLVRDSSWRTSISWRRPLCCYRRIAATFLRPWSSVDWLLCSRFPQMRCPSRSWGFVPPAVLLHVPLSFATKAVACEVPSRFGVLFAFVFVFLSLPFLSSLPSPHLPFLSPLTFLPFPNIDTSIGTFSEAATAVEEHRPDPRVAFQDVRVHVAMIQCSRRCQCEDDTDLDVFVQRFTESLFVFPHVALPAFDCLCRLRHRIETYRL